MIRWAPLWDIERLWIMKMFVRWVFDTTMICSFLIHLHWLTCFKSYCYILVHCSHRFLVINHPWQLRIFTRMRLQRYWKLTAQRSWQPFLHYCYSSYFCFHRQKASKTGSYVMGCCSVAAVGLLRLPLHKYSRAILRSSNSCLHKYTIKIMKMHYMLHAA